MKNKNLILLIFLTCALTITAQVDDSLKNENIHRKSININPSFSLGMEMSGSSRIEYENSNFGKAIIKGELGETKGGVLIDIGLGYGYPLLYSGNNSLFINGYISWISIGLKSAFEGPSEVIEFEYRRTWNNLSINVAPFYRRSDLKFYPEEALSDKSYNKNSIGLRFGIIYSFKL